MSADTAQHMTQAVIFDLDGTLVDSLPGIAAGLNQALGAHGLPSHSNERVRTFIGNGSRMLVKRGIGGDPTEDFIEEVHRDFFAAYSETWIPGTHLYPGIPELLEELHASGLPLAVFSNKPHRYTVEIADKLLNIVSWSVVLGQQDHLPRKPDPAGALAIAAKLALAPTRIAFVGDSSVDFETARAAEMQPVLVDWGFAPTKELTSLAAPLMHSAAELRRFLQEPRPRG